MQDSLACLIYLSLAWPNTALGTLHLYMLPLVAAQHLATRVTPRMPIQDDCLKAGFPLPVLTSRDSVLFSCPQLRVCEHHCVCETQRNGRPASILNEIGLTEWTEAFMNTGQRAWMGAWGVSR